MNAIADTFLDCIRRAETRTEPFAHWLLDGVLTVDACDAIRELPLTPVETARFDGKRETNNDTRSYFNADMCARFPVCRDVVEAFKDPRVLGALRDLCGVDVARGHLRIEYTQDTDGFWLEPHTDISVKMFTMLVYLSEEPELADAGTDIFDSELNHVGRAPYGPNRGLIFVPADDTWHGFVKRPIRGVRRSLIVNYVRDDWRERWQLA